MGYNLAYAVPEVVQAHHVEKRSSVTPTATIDAWALGVGTAGLFSGQPPITLSDGRKQVCIELLLLVLGF